MYSVEGIILTKESQSPVANLQVVLYDIDPGQIQNFKAKMKEASNYQQKTISPFWQRFPGDRIGSVLTDGRGFFKLEFDSKDFQAPAKEERPDLLLLVVAPEDTELQQSGIPGPLPYYKRILHYSFEPIMNSGRRESYIIRLSQKQLDEFNIPYAPSEPVTLESMVADLQSSNALQKGLKETMTEQRRENAKPALALKKKVDEAFRDFTLSKMPKSLREQPTYLNPGDDLAKLQDQLVSQALNDIPNLDGEAGVQRKIALSLTENQLKELGLSLGDDGTVQGEVEAKKLFSYTSRNLTSNGLTFDESTLRRCRKELEAERIFTEALERCKNDAEEDGTGEEEPRGDKEPGDLDTHAFVREQITRQMQHVTSPEKELTYGVERNGKITATITRPGPADVTAYHDFHELQIAFDYIWKEAFDDDITNILKDIYAEVVRFANQVSGVPESAIERINEPIETVDDMHRLLQDVRLLQQIIESNDTEDNSNTAYSQTLQLAVPEIVKTLQPQVTDGDWSKMELSEQQALLQLAGEYAKANHQKSIAIGLSFATLGASLAAIPPLETTMNQKREEARLILQETRERAQAAANSRTRPPAVHQGSSSTRLQNLMTELDQRLGARYKFDIFAPNSVNYGIMLTYRQAWTPKNYQVGDLVSTIPLAPKEVRRYSKKRIVKKSRTQKELEDAQSSRRSESSSTARADAEIVKRASNKTSFEQTAQGTLSLGAFEGTFGTTFGIDAEKASSSTKKNFREAVTKAAEEYKQQHRLEVETSTSEEYEFTDSGEISNPNDEITVTYLFYELQRQYEVREQIHRLKPVILVANEVPEPHEIDEDWLIAHHWILRRVILDDAYLPALDYVTTSMVGDEMALEVMWTNLQRQARLVDEAAEHMKNKSQLAQDAFTELARLTRLIQEPGQVEKFANVNLAAAFGPFALVGLLGGDNEAAEKREEVAKLAIERADKDEQEASARLSREVAALQKAIDQYTTALREHMDRQIAITALRIHIKDNILCYMHAIWDYECKDQRYFRLYNIDVPWIQIEDTISLDSSDHRVFPHQFTSRNHPAYLMEGGLRLSRAITVSKKLSQVADLDNLLGYKGNYMIFPVKEPNSLHWYMMQDYIDPETGNLRDPDEYGNYSTEDLLDYACCLKESGIEESDERYEQVLNLLKERMAAPRKESELIVVPTDSLYIEALPGKHPILEDFKLVHRAIDVKKVQAEVRHDELENLRLAARLASGDFEDANIETQIRTDGGIGLELNTE